MRTASLYEINNRMKLLLVVCISLILQKVAADGNDTVLDCPKNSIFYRQDMVGKLICNVTYIPDDFNVSKKASILKVFDSCGQDLKNSVIKITECKTKSCLELQFINVTWQMSGTYILQLFGENSTTEQSFNITVADKPLLPINVNSNVYFSSNSFVFMFNGSLPKLGQCDFLETTYTSSYQTSNCSGIKQGEFKCDIINSGGNSKELRCYAESLLICDDDSTKDCKIDIKLAGVDKLGSESVLNFSVPSLKSAVPPLKPYFLQVLHPTNSSLTLKWLSPCKPYTYQYYISYQGKEVAKFRESKMVMSYLLRGLKPFTNYELCIKAVNVDNNRESKACIIGKTDEYIPSKAPVIFLKVLPSSIASTEHSVLVSWKLPRSNYWNGEPNITIEYQEKRSTAKSLIKTPDISITKKNYTISDLVKARDYDIRVNLCTSKGCSHSKWVRKMAISQGKTGSNSTAITVVTMALVFVIIIIIVGLIFWIVKRKGLRKYGHLEEANTTGNSSVRVVRPLPSIPQYESSGDNSEHPYSEFPNRADDNANVDDDAGVNFDDNAESRLGDEPSVDIGPLQLQFKHLDGEVGNNPSFELEPV